MDIVRKEERTGGKLNSFISWVGGKKALRKTIYGMMPAKYDRYIEVFGGGGWVLFGKEPDKGVMEVFNDYNADLIKNTLNGIWLVVIAAIYISTK